MGEPPEPYNDWSAWALAQFDNDPRRAGLAVRAATEAQSIGAGIDAAIRAAQSAAGAPPPSWVPNDTSIEIASPPDVAQPARPSEYSPDITAVEAAGTPVFPAAAPALTPRPEAQPAVTGSPADPLEAHAVESVPVSVTPPAIVPGTSAPTATSPLGRQVLSWILDPSIRRRWLLGGSVAFVVGAALALVLSVILITAGASLLAAIFSGSGLGSAANFSSGSSGSLLSLDALKPVGVIWSFVFFQAHLAPYSLSGFGGIGLSVFGLGSMLILAATIAISFSAGRRLERAVPYSGSSARAALRASFIALPFEIGCILLYAIGVADVGSGTFSFQLHPFGVALFLPMLIVGLAAGLGAMSVHPLPSYPNDALRNGIAWGIGGILLGICLTVALGALVYVISGLHAPTSLPSALPSSGGSTPNIQPSSGTSSTFVLAALAAAVFYIPNLLSLAWAAAVSGSVLASGGIWPVVFAAPVLGALFASLHLKARTLLSVGTFALTFGLVSTALVFVATPDTGSSHGVLFLQVLGVASGIGLASAYVGPLLATTAVGQTIGSSLPIRWAGAPWLRLWHRPGGAWIDPSGGEIAATEFRLSRRMVTGLAVLLVIALGAIGANALVGANHTPEKTAVAYFSAEQSGDAATMWEKGIFEKKAGIFGLLGSSSTELLSQDALTGMMKLSQNRDISAIAVKSVDSVTDTTAMVTLTFRRAGSAVTQTVDLRKDSSQKALGIYPVWRVVAPVSSLSIDGGKGLSAVSVDGVSVALSGGSASVDVIAGYHAVDTAESGILSAESQAVDATGDQASVTFKPQAKPGIFDLAKTALLAAFRSKCAGSIGPSPTGCPNDAFAFSATNTSWTLDADPSMDGLSVGDDPQTVVATGNWAMHFHYDETFGSFSSHYDDAQTGPYLATLKWNGSGFDVGDISRY